MSTPTPIEIVREHQRWRRAQGQYAGLCQCPHTPEEIGLALDSVLCDAERFNALERALTDDRIFVSTPDPHDDDLWDPHDGTLAELADRLKGAK